MDVHPPKYSKIGFDTSPYGFCPLLNHGVFYQLDGMNMDEDLAKSTSLQGRGSSKVFGGAEVVTP